MTCTQVSNTNILEKLAEVRELYIPIRLRCQDSQIISNYLPLDTVS